MKGLAPVLASIREVVIRHGGDYPPLVGDVAEILDRYLATRPDFGPLEPPPHLPYQGELLYEDPLTGFIAVLMSWRAGAATSIHDHHGTWGVMGILDGGLRLTNFLRLHDHQVKPAAVIEARPGDVTWILPPDLDVHSIRNPNPRPARSLHVYGANIGF